MRKSTKLFVAMFSVVLLFIAIAVALTNASTHAGNTRNTNGRLVTIHDRGSETTVLTQANTIGDAIKEAGIVIDSKDSVEPAVTEELVASDYQVNIYRARPVLIVDGNVRIKVVTPYQTAVQIAQSVGIVLYQEDLVSIDYSLNLADGAGVVLTVTRAKSFEFTLYGNTNTIRTQANTVSEMLDEKGIKLSSADHLSLDKNTKITNGLIVRLWREGKQTITVEEDVDFEVERIENADKDVSYREIKTPGQKGSRSVTYEVVIQDNQEITRKEIASITITQSKKQVEVVGVRGQYTTPSENETITWDYLISHGFSRVQTAGIMGNLMQEHGFKTSGDGIAQWTGGRRNELYAMPYPNNIYTQLEFLVHELTTNYASVGSAIKASGSLTESVQIFQNKFEKCGICMESNRITFARNILASH